MIFDAPVSSGFAGIARAHGGRTSTVHAIGVTGRADRRWKGDAPVSAPPPWHRATGMAADWPLRDFIELGALPGAVPCARLHARQLMWEWRLTRLSESVEILVSELVTNSVSASQSLERILPVRMWLLSDKARIVILVWDACLQAAVRVEADDEAESGRGLLLVEAISDRWGSYPSEEIGGKVVWATVVQ